MNMKGTMCAALLGTLLAAALGTPADADTFTADHARAINKERLAPVIEEGLAKVIIAKAGSKVADVSIFCIDHWLGWAVANVTIKANGVYCRQEVGDAYEPARVFRPEDFAGSPFGLLVAGADVALIYLPVVERGDSLDTIDIHGGLVSPWLFANAFRTAREMVRKEQQIKAVNRLLEKVGSSGPELFRQ